MKPYVICHMMPSVDGRLRTTRWEIPAKAHDEYERTAETYRADAWVCGRKTMQEFATGRRTPGRRRTGKMKREDYVVPKERDTNYAIAIDSHGKLAWSRGDIEGDPLVEVLTEDVPDSYLTFLRDRGVSYLFAGKNAGKVDLALALTKLGEKFGVRKLLLEGGGETNGTFLRAGLVDEISMLVTPIADGSPGEPALFDVEDRRPAKAVARLHLKSARKIAADMVWIKYAVRNRRRRAA
jgi:2,5-diamino-6-(ribosylamino)-4(3H)-pyrimidinone 5'-phosphate reductase